MEKVIYELPGVYQQLEHMGDVYIKAFGRSLLELLENAGIALFDTMTDTRSLSAAEEREVAAEGFDLESLLYKWLEELLALYYVHNMMCREVRVGELLMRRAEDGELYMARGTCKGEKFDPSKHEPRAEVKSPTYSLMRILKAEEGWTAYFVLDI